MSSGGRSTHGGPSPGLGFERISWSFPSSCSRRLSRALCRLGRVWGSARRRERRQSLATCCRSRFSSRRFTIGPFAGARSFIPTGPGRCFRPSRSPSPPRSSRRRSGFADVRGDWQASACCFYCFPLRSVTFNSSPWAATSVARCGSSLQSEARSIATTRAVPSFASQGASRPGPIAAPGVQLHTSLKQFRLEPRFDITLDRVTHRWSQNPRTEIPNEQGATGWVFVAAVDAFSEDERAAFASRHPYRQYGDYFMLDLRREARDIEAWGLTPVQFSPRWRLLHNAFEPPVRATRAHRGRTVPRRKGGGPRCPLGRLTRF